MVCFHEMLCLGWISSMEKVGHSEDVSIMMISIM